MQFCSVEQLNADIAAWGPELPADIDLIVGIPRSGMLAASLLALHLNLPLTDVEQFVRGELPVGGKRTRQRVASPASHALVLDDSILTGRAIREARARIAGQNGCSRVSYGVVYRDTHLKPGLIDLSCRVIRAPRVFEWNVLHHDLLPRFCVSLEGVLCRAATTEEQQDTKAYARYLRTVPARVVPGEPVGTILSSRLESDRRATEDWLALQGIRYGTLVLRGAAAPGTLADSSGGLEDTAHKAEVYLASRSLLYLEGEPDAAQRLAQISGRSVYSTQAREMMQPSTWGGVKRSVLDLPEQVPATALGYARRLPGLAARFRRTRARAGPDALALRGPSDGSGGG